ncbi:hypothetical protein L3V86_05030 [Thiotrichales bacterium 19S11-10]|nr:hypothetical protein [Thiotrichales bacterium 19S11-10]
MKLCRLMALVIALSVFLLSAPFSYATCRIDDRDLVCSGQSIINDQTVEGSLAINGRTTLKNMKIEGNLIVNGQASLKDVTVYGTTTINGLSNIDGAALYGLTANGPLKIDESTINGATKITGYLDAEETTFGQSVDAAASLIELEESTINGDLTITSDKPATVVLSKASTISGHVIFKKASGTVVKKDDKSRSGDVKNGSSIEYETK